MKPKKRIAVILATIFMVNAGLPAVSSIALGDDRLTTTVYAAEPGSTDELKDKLDYLGSLIDGLKKISGDFTDSQLGWLKQLEKSFEFINKLVKGSVEAFTEARPKLINRVDLLINVAEVITADATELADSEQQAHVIVGFSVTRAMLKATDLFESSEGLVKQSESLMNSLEKARAIDKQTDNSVRTHYTLEKLDRALANAKDLRNKELRDKLDPTELVKVDIAIRKAEDVRRNRRATVAQVNEITNELNATVLEAYLAIPAGERTANNSTRNQLQYDIQNAKNVRDFQLKGNVESKVIAELNRAINLAQRVFNNRNATVNQIEAADESILKATDAALAVLNEKNKPIEEIQEPVVEETEDETVVEEVQDPIDEQAEEPATEEFEEIEEDLRVEAEVEETATEEIVK